MEDSSIYSEKFLEPTFGEQLIGETISNDLLAIRAKELCVELADLLRSRLNERKDLNYTQGLIFESAIKSVLQTSLLCDKFLSLDEEISGDILDQ